MNTDKRQTDVTQVRLIPSKEPVAEVPPLNHSAELGAFLTKLLHDQKRRRDLERERELARLREVQQFD